MSLKGVAGPWRPGHPEASLCAGGCSGCHESIASATSGQETKAALSNKQTAKRGLRRLQNVMGGLLLLSAATGVFLLATDKSLWLLAVSHAVGLVMIVVVDFILGVYSLASSKAAYLPSIAAALLGFVLQLGDIVTAPQYNMTMYYFAHYLFGLGAYDLLLGLQVAIMVVGMVGRPHAKYLSRRRSKRGTELNYTKRGFMKSLAGFAALIGLGVVVGSIKLPAPAAPVQTATGSQAGTAQGSVANANNLKVGVPVYFEYPSGYPNALFKNSDGSLTAVSMLCTHVCCQITFESSSNVFFCPCHGSVFSPSGGVVRGPAAYSLPTIKLRVDSSGNVFPTGVSSPGPCQV